MDSVEPQEEKNEQAAPGILINFHAPCDVHVTHGDHIEVHIHHAKDAKAPLPSHNAQSSEEQVAQTWKSPAGK